jgi:hypothetical protein
MRWNVLKKQSPAEIDWSTPPEDDESKPKGTAGNWIEAGFSALVELILAFFSIG